MHARMEPSVIAEPAGWRRQRGRPPLAEVFGSISTRPTGSLGRKLMAFLGPGYLVAVGYMDPGNWATSLAGGSKFGYALLTVALLSNLMAILLQALCARLGIASGRDLAQACRDAFPRYISWPLWVLAEIAICATDLAEVIGTAIGLNLLFHIPLEIDVILTALDVFLVLWMQNLGFRYIEAFVVTLLGVIAACFAVQIAMVRELEREERIVSFRLTIPDQPGVLGIIATRIGGLGANILEVDHRRLFLDVPAKGAKLDVTLETRDAAHAEEIMAALAADGYAPMRLEAVATTAARE